MGAGRALVWVALGLVLMGSKCRKDEKPPDETHTNTDNHLEPVESKLQVAGIDPSVVTANQSFAAEIYGDGFAKGVQVQIGGSVLSSVTWTSASVLNVTVPGLPAGSYDVTVINPDGKRATQYGGLAVNGGGGAASSSGCAPMTVYFAYDSSAITADARNSLDIWANCVREQDLQVRIEGHSDERGTTEYNLALGQRRADAVARHLSGLGLPKGRVAAVSYGEEKPAARGSGEDAWAQNRRAELTAKP